MWKGGTSLEYNITYRKKDGGWQYIITIKIDGKWKYAGSKQGFKTKALAKKVAEKHLEELKEKYEAQQEAPPEYRELTFKQLAGIYEQHKTLHHSVNTVMNFTNAMKHYKPLFNIPIAEITTLDIQKCVNDMIQKGLTPITIHSYIAILKTFFNFAIKIYKIIKTNPTKDLVLPKLKGPNKIRALNKKDLEDLLSKIKYPRFYIASLIAAKCGLRIGEILGLTWDRVDFKSATITVDRQWKEIKKGKWGFSEPKSNNSYRVVPMPPIVADELMKFKRQFPVHISNRILPYKSIPGFSSNLARLYKSLGYNISIHDLRHTYATTLIANGLDFKTVAQLLGHDVKETIRTYSHVTSDMLNNAANLINNIF